VLSKLSMLLTLLLVTGHALEFTAFEILLTYYAISGYMYHVLEISSMWVLADCVIIASVFFVGLVDILIAPR